MTGLRNRSGAALVWAVCALLILAILATALATSALAYHRRSMGDENARQAWLTARSAADALLAVLTAEATPVRGAATAQAAYASLLAAHPWLPPVGQEVEHVDFSLNLSPLSGTVEAIYMVCRAEAGAVHLAITTTAAVGDRQECLTLRAVLASGAGGGYVWSAGGYE